MEFRPCIDIHNGKVKQIVGGSLLDEQNTAVENFVSKQDSVFYAEIYRNRGIRSGHVILLNSPESEFFDETKKQAIQALQAYPGGLQVGGGVTPQNAGEFLDAGASHVIVTSFVFQNGQINFKNLDKMVKEVGLHRLVLDLSCRKKNGKYYIVTDRWQKYTDVILTEKTLEYFSGYCDEFLIHAVDSEGKANGIEEPLVELLGKWTQNPVTYAGGVHSYEDLRKLKILGQDRVNVTIGSALDLFGGDMKLDQIISFIDKS